MRRLINFNKVNFNKDQRGIGAVMVIIAVVVLAVIGGIGYKLTQKDSVVPKHATAAQKKAANECLKLYNDKDLCKFSVNSDIEKLSYKIVMTNTDTNGQTTKLTLLSDGKGNNQLSSGSGAEAFDSILLDGVSYLKDNTDGTWLKLGGSDASTAQSTDPAKDIKVGNTFSDAVKDNYSYKKLGKEKCGKLTCFKYQFTDKTQPNATAYVWFDTKDYRMQRYSGKDDTSGSYDMVITYQSVKITAPSPVKDFSAGASGASSADLQSLQQQLQNLSNDNPPSDTSSDDSAQ